MASTYENDLRLEEMATGENSGSWGTKTNTNLELVADAFSYGTETIADADTAITIADGAADAARSLALKINSSEDLTTTRVVTLGPNTTSKVWIIENNTSGGQTLTISAGSGSNVTLPNGVTKIIATDGIGAAANVTELYTNLHNITIDGTLTVDGILSLADGTNSAPSLTNTGDTNTGLYFPAADEVGITVGGTQVFKADSTGVDITGQLQADSGQFDGNVNIDGTLTSDGLTVDGDASIVTETGTDASLIIRNDTDTTPSAFIDLRRGATSETFGADNYVDYRIRNSTSGVFELTQGKNTVVDTIHTARYQTDGFAQFSWNNGNSANTLGQFEFHQENDSASGGLAILNSNGFSMRFYVDSNGTRKITSGSTAFISFTNESGYPEHIGLNKNVAINPDGATINSGFPAAPLHIKSSSTTGMLILESDYDGSASTPDLYFYNNSATPEDDDLIGNILFRSNDDAGNAANMAQIFIQATDVSAGSFNSKMMLKTSVDGSLDSRLILTGAGNVTIGTGTMERTNLASGSASLSVEGTTASSAGMSIIRNSNDANPAYLTLGKSRGSSTGSNTILQDGDDIGRIVFAANDSTNFLSSADIISRVEETTPSTNNVGATLELRTGGGSNVAGTSRIQIKSDGRIRFNNTDIDDGAYIFRCLGNTADDALSVFSSDEGGSMRFLVDTAGVRAMYAGTEEVMRFKSGQSDSGRVTFTKGDGIRVDGGQSAFTHTDFEPYNLGTVSPTLYLGYNSVSRSYTIDPSVELAVERASDAVINIVTDASSSSSIWFGDNSAGASGQINYDHSSDSMLFKTAATTAFNVNSSGNISFPDGQGVLFSAAQSGNGESSLLHDYEEGSYTPVLTLGGSSVNAPAWASGTYTKIGNRVLVDIRMSWSGSLGSELGGAKVTLPFAVYNSESSTQWEAIGSFFSLANVTTTLVPAFSDVAGGLIFAETQGTSNEADHNDFPSTSNFRVTGSYRTSA